jgi:NADH-quinone oxidoreductase subunit H
MAEYGSMFAVSGLASILFFGGWHGPIPITHLLGMAYEPGEGFRILGYLANLLGMLNFIIKSVILVTVMMWVRWTLPRLRIDQVMTTCLKYCTPLAAMMFLGAVGWTYLLPGGIGLRSQPYAFVLESPPYISPMYAVAEQPAEATTPPHGARRGSPDPAALSTEGLPGSDKSAESANDQGDLRSAVSAGSGDPRRARSAGSASRATNDSARDGRPAVGEIGGVGRPAPSEQPSAAVASAEKEDLRGRH